MATPGQDEALDLVDGRVRALRTELAALGDRYDDAEESELTKAISIATNRKDRPALGLVLAEKVLRRALLSGSRAALQDFLFRFGAHVKASVGLPGLSSEERLVLALGARDVFASGARMKRQVQETDSIIDRLPDVDVTDAAWRRQFGMTRDELHLKVAVIAGGRSEGTRPPVHATAGQGPRILRERPIAEYGDLPSPDWLRLPSGTDDNELHGAVTWPALDPDGKLLKPAFAQAWTAFEEADYRECRKLLWEVFARCGTEWFPTGTQDGTRTWNWLRLVWLLGQRADEGFRNRRRALVSALVVAERSVPNESDLIDSLVDGALADYVAVEPEMRRNWAVHASRVAVATGADALNVYTGEEKADLRSAWEDHFGDLVSGMRQTHQMAEALTSEYKFRAQALAQAANPDEQVHRRIVAATRRIEAFLDSDERKIANAICDVATNLVTLLARDAPLASDLENAQSRIAASRDELARSESVLLQDSLGPALISMANSCSSRQVELSSASRPDIVATLLNNRLPLSSKVQEPFSIAVALRNKGNASAELVEATLESLAVEITESLRVVERIPAGAERVVQFRAESLAEVDLAALTCELTWRDPLEQTFTAKFELLAEDQRPTAWQHDDVNPFSLQTISNPANLVGRRDDLDALSRLVSAGGSVAVTGLKRVGKSSLAKSLLSRLRADAWATDFLPLGQVLTGRPNAAELVTALLETIFDAIVTADAEVLVPEPPKPSAESFTRTAGRWIRQAAAVVTRHDLRVLVAIDDFDELPRSLYEGPEADALFLFLRSVIDESWLSLMFIGSEVLPAILGAQAHKLNQVATVVVSNFKSPAATKALLEHRTKSRLEWQDASFNRAHFLAGGNPYYLTLLGQEVWQRMRDLDRTYVAVADIEEAAGRLEIAASSTHFLHLWADSLTGLNVLARASLVANAVLVGVARASGVKFASASRHHVVETAIALVPSATTAEVRASISSLLSRGVLDGGEELLRIVVPLASGWLRRTGGSELERQLVEVSDAAASERTVSSLELVQLASNVQFCGDQLSEVRLKAWLEQFPAGTQRLAFQAAHRLLTDGYFSSTRMTQEVLPQLKSGITKTDAWGLREADSGGYAKNVYVLKHGLAGSSSPGFIATLIRLLKIKKSNVVDVDGLLRATKNLSRPSVLVVADDVAGTGKQLKGVVDAAIASIPSSGPWREHLSVVVAAAISASSSLPAPADFNVEVVVGLDLGPRHLLFDESAGIYEVDHERDAAIDVFDAVGRSLSPQTPRGFGDLGLLATTEHNCPNNAPPMFWKAGEHAGKPWLPLLERRL